MRNPIDTALSIMHKSHGGHPNHYFEINGYKICARCSGMLLSLFFVYPLFIGLYIRGIKMPFALLIALLLGTINLLNWVIGQYRTISNESRFISGVCFSFGMSIYLFMLPEEPIKYIILPVYFMLAIVIISTIQKKKLRYGAIKGGIE